ncbi:MAG: hypothetical protein KAH99_06650, partial [Verrucomicrobia bacterium]|nr:hypothetical protein [Verrucomicrobiota bacterium]
TNTVESTTKILEGELRLMLSLAGQCETGEVVIMPDKGAIRISETFVPGAGTRLATLVGSAKTSKPNPRIPSGLLGDGMILTDFTMGNPDAFADFISAEAENLFKEMEIKEIDFAGLTEKMVKWMRVCSGAACETFDFDIEDGMGVNYLLEVGDEAAALGLLKTMKDDMAPFLKLYEGMGVEMDFEFEENEREYKGIKIHQLEMEISMEGMPEDQRQQMDAMDLDEFEYDIAIFDGLMLYTMGETPIETVIDRIKDPATMVKPIAARGVYPEGGFYYFDFDVGRYMEFVASMMPGGTPNPISPQFVAMMQGADPITSAGFRQEGRVMWSINIPGDLIGKLGQMAMMMQMQNMQQQQMPQGMPQGLPVQ